MAHKNASYVLHIAHEHPKTYHSVHADFLEEREPGNLDVAVSLWEGMCV